MDCQRVADDELVERYLNGQLDPALQDDFEVHILECSRCLARAETFKSIRSDLVERAHEIRLMPAKRARWLYWAWVGVAAALIIACVVAFSQLRYGTRQPIQQAGPQKPGTSQDANLTQHAPSGTQPPGQKQPETATTSKKQEVGPPGLGKGTNPEQAQIAHPSQITNSQGSTEQHSDQNTAVTASNSAKPGTSRGEMSEAEAVELYKLAEVEAPPYTFAGASAGAKPPGASANPSQGFTPGGGGPALFQSAMVAYVEKRYGDAADRLENVVAKEPKAADANFYLGICRLMEGRPQESIAPLKAALAAPPGRLTQSAHFYLAKAYLQTGNVAEAEREMQAAAALAGWLTPEAQSLAARIQALRNPAGTQDNSGAAKPK